MAINAALLALLLSWPASAAEEVLEHPYWSLPASTAPVKSPVPAMETGETLEYDIYWGAVYVGKSYLRIDKVVEISSRPAWHIVSEAKSGSFLANFYRVADRNDAWMDVGSLHSYGYYKKIQEGGYFFNEWVIFDLPTGRVYGEKMNKKRQRNPVESAISGPVNDVLSSLYRMRAMDLKPGSDVELDVNTKRNWRIRIKAAGKTEKISVPFGKKKCLKFEPMAGEEGIFVAKAGRRMLVWITEDELKLPLMLKAEIFIGSVTAKLVKRTIRPEY